MFCDNCGAKIDKGARFCGVCGAPVSEAEEEMPNSGQMEYRVPADDSRRKKSGRIGKWIIFGIVAIIALVVFNKINSPERVTKKMLESVARFDLDQMLQYYAFGDECESAFLEEIGQGNIDSAELNEVEEQGKAYLEEYYGDNYKIEIKVLDKGYLSNHEAVKEKEELLDKISGSDASDENDLSLVEDKISSIKKIYFVKTRVKVTGSENSDNSEAFEVYCIKKGLKWYVLDAKFS